MSGQHVGGLTDALQGDQDLEAARGSRAALARLAKPTGKTFTRRDSSGLGSGDVCPIEAEHGKMYVSKNQVTQFCPDQAHAGDWTERPHQPPTRSRWPFQGFDAAVTAWKENQDG